MVLGWKVKDQLGLQLTAIRRGFTLYECLLVLILFFLFFSVFLNSLSLCGALMKSKHFYSRNHAVWWCSVAGDDASFVTMHAYCCFLFPFFSNTHIRSMMIVWRIRWEIIRFVLCWQVCRMTCCDGEVSWWTISVLSLVILVSVVLVSSCRQTEAHRIRDVD